MGSAAFFLAAGALLAGALVALFGLAVPVVAAAPPAALVPMALISAPSVDAGAGAGTAAGAGAAVATSVGRGGQGLGRRTLRLVRRSRTAAASSAITLRPPRSCTGVPGATEMPDPPVAAEEFPPPLNPPAAGADAAAGSGAAADSSGAGAAAAPPFWRAFWPAACDALLLAVFLAGLFLGVSHPLGASHPPLWAAAEVAKPPVISRKNNALFMMANLRG